MIVINTAILISLKLAVVTKISEGASALGAVALLGHIITGEKLLAAYLFKPIPKPLPKPIHLSLKTAYSQR